MRRLRLEKTYNAHPDDVFEILSDPDFQRRKCERTAAGPHQSAVRTSTESVHIETERSFPTDSFPDVARRLVGPHLVVHEFQEWGQADAHGNRTATLTYQVPGVPIGLRGVASLTAENGGTVERVDAQVTCSVPLVGGKIEEAAERPIRYALDIEAELLQEDLDGTA